MNTPTKTEASMKELLGGNRLGELQSFIARSQGTAEKILAHGDFVREKFKEGNLNSARAGSAEGSLMAASELVQKMDSVPAGPKPQPYFGQNIREVWDGLRPLFRGK